MKNDTTFVRMRSGDHLGDPKNVEKRHLASSNLSFFESQKTKTVFAEWKKKGWSTKLCLKIFNFCLGTKLWSFKI